MDTFDTMFDIKEYYREQLRATDSDRAAGIGDIEEDISFDIDSILMNRFDSLYRKDKFKHMSNDIEIIYPRVSFPGTRTLFRGPDHMRSLLSLYPFQKDLECLDKVVLRPRHIDIGDIELMALYLRKKKILVMYLHLPHTYTPDQSKFHEYAEYTPFRNPGGASAAGAGQVKTSTGATVSIPPLWYILSMISASGENIIDKFFLRKDPARNLEISRSLDEISFFFSRHGY